MIPLLLALQLAATPRRLPGGPEGTHYLTWRHVPGAVAYSVETLPGSPFPACVAGGSSNYSAAFACPDGINCQVGWNGSVCHATVKVWDGTAYGLRVPEARVWCDPAAGTGCPCELFPREEGCVYP